MDNGSNTRHIDYPCEWGYRVVGADEQRVREAIATVFAGRAHTVKLSNRSRTGKYCSLEATTTVTDDEDRVTLARRLGSHPEVRVVL